MNFTKKVMIALGFISMVVMAHPATANSSDFNQANVDKQRAQDIIGGIGGIIFDQIKKRQKAKFHCTAEGRRNRGRDVVGRGYTKARVKNRHRAAQTMRQVCIQALNDCIRQFRRKPRGERSCIVINNEIDVRFGGDKTIHRFIGRTIYDLDRGRGRGPGRHDHGRRPGRRH